MVLPQQLREALVEVPGELLIEQTDDGVLLRPVRPPTTVVRMADDGLPALYVNRRVTNEDVLAAIDRERADR